MQQNQAPLTPHYVYQITNLINGKIYVGVHQRGKKDPLVDGYLGSGKAMKTALRKYGRCNFKKEVLAEFDCGQLAYELEQEIVTKQFIMRSDVYNQAPGGRCGFYNRGLLLPEERQKRSEQHSRKVTGTANSQYGSRWMNDGSVDKKAQRDEVDALVGSGWSFGKIKLPPKPKKPKQPPALGWWVKHPEEEVLQKFDEFGFMRQTARHFGYNIKSCNKVCSAWFAARGRVAKRGNRYKTIFPKTKTHQIPIIMNL